MTKFNLLNFAVLSMMVLAFSANAQKMNSFATYGDATAANNSYLDYVGGKISVLSPASVAGLKDYTIANDSLGDPAGNWGATIKSLGTSMLKIEIVKGDPYDGCNALTNTTALAGKIALIKRGTCEFGAKARNAQTAGAVACIIVNNNSGPVVGMAPGQSGAGLTIPIIMITKAAGDAIEAELNNNVTVEMSMTEWSNGFPNDIGILRNGVAVWDAFSIPLNQIQGNSANAYKGFDGAVIGNFGTTTANKITLKATVYWTPDGGSKTEINKDSVEIATPFAPTDSIISPFIDKVYTLNPTTTGRYDVEYEVTPDFVDGFPGDNKASYSFRVDSRIYSKGRYDHTNNVPFSNGSSRFSDNSDFLWGAMYYMEQAGYGFEHAKLAIAKDNAVTDSSMVGEGTVQVMVWKWVDGNGDSIMIREEMELVGLGSKTFGGTDTSSQVHDVVIKQAQDEFAQVVTEANTWYWVTANVPGTLRMPVDGEMNQFVRAWGRKKSSTSTRVYGSPLYSGSYEVFRDVTSTPNANGGRDDIPAHWPFERYFFSEDSARYAQQKNGMIASIPVQMSLFKVDVNEVVGESTYSVEMYPNPASDVLNVALNLDKKAEHINYTVLNSLGQRVAEEDHHNLSKDTYTVSTKTLAAGTYYLVINVDNESKSRKFTVIKQEEI